MLSNRFFAQVARGSLLIAGTTIGAGMLGIPLLTAKAGFFPAILVTTIVWIFMLLTGLLFLEVTLWMKDGANILSMSKRFLGNKGRALSGVVYLFLYYCLMIAYFSAGAPLLASFIKHFFSLNLEGVFSNGFFGIIFFAIVALGIKSVDRVNYILMIGLILSFLILVGIGFKEIDGSQLLTTNWFYTFYAAPVLFSAFGYHNVIPSLTSYFKRNLKVLRLSIIWGTTIPYIVYVIWQCLILGAVSDDLIQESTSKGLSIIYSLQLLTNKPIIQILGQIFSFFAIVTSIMGVAFSMVDFIGDGLNMKRVGKSRLFLCGLTFLPPFFLSSLDPSLFLVAISIAGGFGEAFLNGILPVSLVYVGRYKNSLKPVFSLLGEKWVLACLLIFALFVMAMEGVLIANL